MSARTSGLLVVASLVAFALEVGSEGTVQAQTPGFGFSGIQYQDPFGNSQAVSFSRLFDPRANIPVAGSENYYEYQDPFSGNYVRVREYWGMDGRPHRDQQVTTPFGNTQTTMNLAGQSGNTSSVYMDRAPVGSPQRTPPVRPVINPAPRGIGFHGHPRPHHR